MLLQRLCSALLVSLSLLSGVDAMAQAETGGYPWANGPTCASDCQADDYGFYKRECTSFVAWKLHAVNDVTFKNDFNGDGLLDFGDATHWRTAAESLGFQVDTHPAIGAIAWWSFGHVAWVEAVQADQVIVQEYNYDYQGNFNRRIVSASAVHAFIHIKDIGNSATELTFIKTKHTDSGAIEMHRTIEPFQQVISNATRLSLADQDNGWFGATTDKLWFVKTRNAKSDQVELHWLYTASSYQSGLSLPTSFSLSDQANGIFSVAGTDVVFIKTKNTGSGRVEIHRIGAANYLATPTSLPTAFSVADADNGWFEVIGTKQDLAFIKTKHTDSGRIEVHIAPADCGFCGISQSLVTAFSIADQTNGNFVLKDMTGDRRPDLVFVKTRNTDSGMVELFVADAAWQFSYVTAAFITAFSTVNAENGWFSLSPLSE